MAEPQPEDVSNGMSGPSTSAEERKTAAAMDALEANDDAGTQGPRKNLDALGEAISRLEMGEKASNPTAVDTTTITPAEQAWRDQKEHEQRERDRRAKIKVDAADVALLTTNLSLSKAKATELLRLHEGDFAAATRAFVRDGLSPLILK